MGIDRDGERNKTGDMTLNANLTPDTSLFGSANGVFFIDTISFPKWHINHFTNNTTVARNRFNMDISRIAPTANDNRVLTASSIKWRRTN